MTAAIRAFLLLVLLVWGYVAWSVAFVGVYGSHALACFWLDHPDAWWAVLALWGGFAALHAVFLAWVWARVRRRRTGADDGARPFLTGATFGVAATALAATLWIGIPILFLAACR